MGKAHWVPVFMCDKKTHERIKRFPGIAEAARQLGNEKSAARIASCVIGKTPSAMGYYWCYADKGHVRKHQEVFRFKVWRFYGRLNHAHRLDRKQAGCTQYFRSKELCQVSTCGEWLLCNRAKGDAVMEAAWFIFGAFVGSIVVTFTLCLFFVNAKRRDEWQ